MFTCRVCSGSSEPKAFILYELMFGTREQFEYLQCNLCGCLQITKIPDNLGSYYAGGYYSLSPATIPSPKTIRNSLAKRQLQASLGHNEFIGLLANTFKGELEIASWFRYSGCGLNSRILDVGCGNGRLLLRLRNMGFTNLEGVDPYVESDIDYANGVSVRRGEIDSVTGCYDLVMMHHSLEHVPDPVSMLTAVAKITSPKGCLLIRVPVVDCEAWDIYRENWVQLDAPRHLHLFSRKSIETLAMRCGFVVENVIYDSHAMQFWASEQYRNGISLRDPRSVMTDAKSSIFSRAEIRTFGKRATLLNKANRGDQACFFLRPVASNTLNSTCYPAAAEIHRVLK